MSSAQYGEIGLATLPPMWVARCRAVGTDPENEAFGRMAAWLAASGLAGQPETRTFGFDMPQPPSLQAEGQRGYEVWASVPEGTPGGGGIDTLRFEGGRYARMAIHDPFSTPFETIPGGWRRIVRWAGENGWRIDDRPGLEELVQTPEGEELVLFLPVV